MAGIHSGKKASKILPASLFRGLEGSSLSCPFGVVLTCMQQVISNAALSADGSVLSRSVYMQWQLLVYLQTLEFRYLYDLALA